MITKLIGAATLFSAGTILLDPSGDYDHDGMSNAAEDKALTTSAYQHKLAVGGVDADGVAVREVAFALLRPPLGVRDDLRALIAEHPREFQQAAVAMRREVRTVMPGGKSGYTKSEMKSLVKEADVQVYAIGIFSATPSTLEEQTGPVTLSGITDVTGGRPLATTRKFPT